MRSRGVTALGLATALFAVAIGWAGTPSASAVTIEWIPPSIASDCSRDVTVEIQAWIDSVADGSLLTFPSNRCYRVDGTLLVKDRVGLTIQGNRSTFRAMTDGSELPSPSRVRTRNMWTFLRGSGLVMRNVIVFGANPHAGIGELAYQPKFEAQHAYLVMSTKGILLDRVEAYDVYGDFVWVGPGTENLTVRGSTFARNGRQGWTINGKNILFENNSISDTRRATIDMEPSQPTWASQNVTIRNNRVGRGRLFFFASVGAAAPIDRVSIIGNRLVGKAMVIFVAPPKGTRSNYRVIGNTSDVGVSGSGSAMVFKNIVGLEVRGNVQPVQLSHWLAGVAVRASTHVAISDNVFRGAKAPIIDRGENRDIRQWNNTIGWPMVVAPPTSAAGPTPPYVRPPA